MAGGIDLFSKYSDQTQYARYENRMTGGQLRLGFPVTEEFGFTLRYSLYQQDLKVPNTETRPYNDCSVPLANTQLNGPSGIPGIEGTPNRSFCELNGEASLAIKEAAGETWTSAGGVTLAYSTLDNGKNPRNGFYAEVKPDVAGLGGDSKYVRVLGDARYYHELFEDIVGIARVQGGHVMGHSGEDLRRSEEHTAELQSRQ